MLTVDEFARIRRAAREGMSIREMARRFGHSRKSIRKALANGEPPPYTLTQPREAPVLGGYHGVIDQILADDRDAPPKQRHTAAQIYRRLRDEQGYPGSYDQVRRYVAKQRRLKRATFIPLAHEPGRRLEADFGHIEVDYLEGPRIIRRRGSALLRRQKCPIALAATRGLGICYANRLLASGDLHFISSSTVRQSP